MSKFVSVEILCAQLLEVREVERAAQERRRQIEDELNEALGISEALEGVENKEVGKYKVKVTGRINRTVDGDKLQELAAEHGLSLHLRSLFRWRPSINMSQWRNADKAITEPLSAAITAKPGRPSISIEIDS